MMDDMHIAGGKGGEDDDDDDEPVETYEQFEKRVNTFVAVSILKHSPTKRDDYKDGLVFQERKNLIAQFMKSTHAKKCPNSSCGA